MLGSWPDECWTRRENKTGILIHTVVLPNMVNQNQCFSFSTCNAVIWLFTKHYYSLKQIYQCSVLAHPLKGHQDWIILSRILRGVKRSTNHESPPSSTIMHICVYSLSHAIGRSPLVITQLQNSHPYIWSSRTFNGILREGSLFSSKLYLLRSKGSS